MMLKLLKKNVSLIDCKPSIPIIRIQENIVLVPPVPTDEKSRIETLLDLNILGACPRIGQKQGVL
jgi:hypothetical protein